MAYRGMPFVSVPENETCSVDRSTLALHYSSNLVDWTQAGVIDSTLAFHRHFAHPSALIDGEDLLIVSESTFGGERIHPCAPVHVILSDAQLEWYRQCAVDCMCCVRGGIAGQYKAAHPL
jgi:hypothetical protein